MNNFWYALVSDTSKTPYLYVYYGKQSIDMG